MEYSEYRQKELAINQRMNELQKEYQAAMMEAKQELSDLANDYLGDFAVGKAVKVLGRPEYEGHKFYVEQHDSICDSATKVSVRKAKKDGSPSINGVRLWYIDIKELEAWNEL